VSRKTKQKESEMSGDLERIYKRVHEAAAKGEPGALAKKLELHKVTLEGLAKLEQQRQPGISWAQAMSRATNSSVYKDMATDEARARLGPGYL
jgi:hypothetical protein